MEPTKTTMPVLFEQVTESNVATEEFDLAFAIKDAKEACSYHWGEMMFWASLKAIYIYRKEVVLFAQELLRSKVTLNPKSKFAIENELAKSRAWFNFDVKSVGKSYIKGILTPLKADRQNLERIKRDILTPKLGVEIVQNTERTATRLGDAFVEAIKSETLAA